MQQWNKESNIGNKNRNLKTHPMNVPFKYYTSLRANILCISVAFLIYSSNFSKFGIWIINWSPTWSVLNVKIPEWPGNEIE